MADAGSINIMSPDLRIYALGDVERRTKLPRNEIARIAAMLNMGEQKKDERGRPNLMFSQNEMRRIVEYQRNQADGNGGNHAT